ncbi:MAG: Fic family protein [Rhodospirillales bacterium]
MVEALHADLRAWPAAPRPAHARTEEGRASLAFFEAYFSNFIEGTEFDVSEAAGIVFDGKMPTGRPADAHDVLGTWRVVSDDNEMARTPATPEAFLDLLRARHADVMAWRPEARPGEFKTVLNQAGGTIFVAPELVCGTLEQCFGFYSSLDAPFARAVMMMFLTAEVHPFADGNGRVARIMMNAELAAAGEERIIIPTVYRNNYMQALKALSQSGATTALIRTLDYAQKWTAAAPWSGVEAARRVLERCNAFVDANYADAKGLRLEMPPLP